MARTHGLFRLLRVRQLEEEDCKTALNSALTELNRLFRALKNAAEREQQGRMLLLEGIRACVLPDRLAGLEEVRAARALQRALIAKIEAAEQVVDECRARYTEKRIQRRQVESLLESAKAKDAEQTSRRTQEELDDRHHCSMWQSQQVRQRKSSQPLHPKDAPEMPNQAILRSPKGIEF
jgi:flagellar export protein FliJ